jgi:hypothetical protein
MHKSIEKHLTEEEQEVPEESEIGVSVCLGSPFIRGLPRQTLSQKLVGHFAYYGITGNSSALNRFRIAAAWIWKRWLTRRRRRGRMTWDRLNRFLKRHPLLPAIAIHSVCRPVALE